MKPRKFMPILWYALALILFARCSPAPTATPTPRPSPSPSATVSPSPTSTPSPSPTEAPTPLPSATPTATPFRAARATLSATDQAAFVGETIPDYTQLTPGEKFTKTWTLRNTGPRAWTAAYSFVRGAGVPAGTALGAPASVPLPTEVPPGGKITLAVPMTAPQETGTYTLYWALLNPQGEIVPISGGRSVWVTVRVCAAGQPCPTPPSAPTGATTTVGNITARLLGFQSNATGSTATFCLYDLPNRNYLPLGMELLVDGKVFPTTGGGSTVLIPGKACFQSTFGATAAQINAAQDVAVVVPVVRNPTPPDADARCQQAHDQLVKQYPGLDFTCHFSMAGYYTNLKLPPGMSREKADRLITDLIEGAIYGPWVLPVH